MIWIQSPFDSVWGTHSNFSKFFANLTYILRNLDTNYFRSPISNFTKESLTSGGSVNWASTHKNKVWDEMDYNEVKSGEISAMTRKNVANEVRMEYKKQK